MADIIVGNAIIESARFDNERGLSAWLMLDYHGSGQGFGGFMLYTPPDWGRPGELPKAPQLNYCGHWVYRCLQIADVDDWGKLPGRTIRVRRGEWGPISAIGHIVKDDWFDPKVEFEKMKAERWVRP
jgi:hypothetical protein